MKILVTGATGYIGGRLVPRLLKKGYQVRAVARNLLKLEGRYWASHENLELVAADVLDYNALVKALEGCDVAYYLVHSMVREHKKFETTDREAALNFVAAAESVKLKRLIYLGGLGNELDKLSRHLQSRKEVGEIFYTSSVPVTILRAAMIIGAGSASFEILRYLVDRLPYMITPKWVRTEVQPIAIANVLAYLIGVLEQKQTIGQTYDIGGMDRLTYQDLMDLYAEEAGLKKRHIYPVSVLSPWLSSKWISIVTPLPATLGKALVEGLSNKVICEESRIRELIPQKLISCREAIHTAVDRLHHNRIETSWVDAGSIPPAEWVDQTADPQWSGGTIYEEKSQLIINHSPEKVWRSILKVGGKTGWYSPNWMWKIRGWIDKWVGGVGLMRGRKNCDSLQLGDAVDFWRVYHIDSHKRLVLVAEMKLPGKAALEFHLHKKHKERTELTVIARFLPRGLWGILYWYSLFPVHFWIFSSMLKQINKDVQKEVSAHS
ncbi:MAG: hypothetical protein S4CHLAM123_12720 [Chlamydiales bacterium]|nr:hypothetical protein [Chlamydiales bacterium]